MLESIEPDRDDPNSHIWEYLKYYLSFDQTPHFAVLLNGPWGIGKTHLIQKILDAHFKGWKDEWLYVSLFGVSTLEQLNDALFAAIYPSLNSPLAKAFGQISTSALKKYGVDFKTSPKLFLSNFKKKPYVFDDFERCNLPAHIVLGYINTFVEHDGCKVLIIANEEEIYANEGIKQEEVGATTSEKSQHGRQREKVIGKTLRIQSPLNEAFAYFMSKVADVETRQFLQQKRAVIQEMCAQAKLVNLRVLQQTIWDFERVFNMLTGTHRDHDEAMTTLLRLFFAISFELKTGGLSEQDIRARSGGEAAAVRRLMNKEAQPSKLEAAQSRHPDTDLWDELLSNEILIDTLSPRSG